MDERNFVDVGINNETYQRLWALFVDTILLISLLFFNFLQANQECIQVLSPQHARSFRSGQ